MPDQARTITRLELAEENDQLRLIYEGSGFLRYMVRMMTGTLIEVGRGTAGAAGCAVDAAGSG